MKYSTEDKAIPNLDLLYYYYSMYDALRTKLVSLLLDV